MVAPTLRLLLFAAACATLASTATAITYTATLLHPDDFLSTIGVGVSNVSQVGSGQNAEFTGPSHAMLWTGSANSYVDLNGGFTASYAQAATDTHQLGNGYGNSTGQHVPSLLLNGTAGSVVDLHPSGFETSRGMSIDGTKQVGYGLNSSDVVTHALLWSGTAGSAVDLHPTGFVESFANGVSGPRQVGYGVTVTDQARALMWSGTAASKIDLHPAGFSDSYANGVYTDGATSKQVGSGTHSLTGETRALLWSGSAGTKVDLHPASGFTYSEAIGISAAGQVGDGSGSATNFSNHALYWNGTAASVVDLHTTLFANTGYDFVSSQAYSIAPNGNIVGTATDDGFNTYAILWTPQPDGPVESGVDGDYNNNGIVDAADYVAWRKGGTLYNEVASAGTNTPQDYTEWRMRFGSNTPGSGVANTPVPEPATATLVLLTALCLMVATGRQRSAPQFPAKMAGTI